MYFKHAKNFLLEGLYARLYRVTNIGSISYKYR